MKCKKCGGANGERELRGLCIDCELIRVRAAETHWRLHRETTKAAARIRSELLFLEKLAASDAGSTASETLADAAELRRVESRLADAVTHLRETRNRIRKQLRDKWTKASIDAAIAATVADLLKGR